MIYDYDPLFDDEDEESLYPEPRNDDALTLFTWAIPKFFYGLGYMILWSFRGMFRLMRWYVRW